MPYTMCILKLSLQVGYDDTWGYFYKNVILKHNTKDMKISLIKGLNMPSIFINEDHTNL